MKTTRLAGTVLAASVLLWILMIAAWPFVVGSTEISSTDGSSVLLDRANHMLDKQTAFRAVWIIEAIGAIGMAVAALLLIRRDQTRDSIAALGWAAVCIGGTAYIAMYGIMLGTYWPAAQMVDSNPAVLASAITGAMALFFLSNVTFNTGFALAFFVEARLDGSVVPTWLAWAGFALSALGAVGALAGLIATPEVGAVTSLDAFALVAAIHFVTIAALGFGLARQNPN